MSEDQHIKLRLVVAEQHGRPQVFPLVTLQQALRVFDLEPHSRVQQHSPFERARGSPLSEATVADDVQTRRSEGAVGCADDEGGEGSGATGVEVDVVVFGDGSDDVEDLGREENGDRGADEDVGEDGGETHDVKGLVGVAVLFCSVEGSWHSRTDWLGGGKDRKVLEEKLIK